MRDIVLLSFTALDAGGGVPRWNRDFVAGFPGTKHFSWDDVVKMNPGFAQQGANVGEWDKAQILNQWLIWGKKVKKDDIIISDGFWGESLSSQGYNVVSIAHGIWSHLTKEDVDSGKSPDFPYNHAMQVKHRQDHLGRGKPIVAVSDFISTQMKLQWGFKSTVINNAIDLQKFLPKDGSVVNKRPLIVHGVTTANKGFEHIEAVKRACPDADVLLLDEAAQFLNRPKYEALAHANLVVQPSAYEGNSYFVLETLACDVPIVAYNVGLLYSIVDIARAKGLEAVVGCVMNRRYRSPQETARISRFILDSVMRPHSTYNPRKVAELFSIERFHEEWRKYLEEYNDALDKGR